MKKLFLLISILLVVGCNSNGEQVSSTNLPLEGESYTWESHNMEMTIPTGFSPLELSEDLLFFVESDKGYDLNHFSAVGTLSLSYQESTKKEVDLFKKFDEFKTDEIELGGENFTTVSYRPSMLNENSTEYIFEHDGVIYIYAADGEENQAFAENILSSIEFL
jgi:hypothetical protein